MAEQPLAQPGNGRAIGISVIAAGVLGAIGSSVFGRKPTRAERAQAEVTTRLDRLESIAAQSLDQLTQALEGLTPKGTGAKKNAGQVSKSAMKSADAALKATRQRIAEIDRESARLKAVERANAIGHEGSLRATELARTLGSRASSALDEARSAAPGWKSKASQSVIDAKAKGAELAHQATASAPDARDLVAHKALDFASKGSALAAQARDQKDPVVDKANKALEDVAERGAAVVAQLREKAPDAREQVGKTAQEVAGLVKEHAPDVRERASRVASVASERASELSAQAKQRAPEVVGAVSAQLDSVVHHAQPLVEEASQSVSKAIGQAKDAGRHAGETLLPEVQHKASELTHKATDQGQAALANLSSVSSSASGKLSTTTGTIEHKSKAAASAAGRGTKEATALVGWSLAAAGVIYYALLNERQREKVAQSAKRIGAEIRDVYQDVRGYDGEFK